MITYKWSLQTICTSRENSGQILSSFLLLQLRFRESEVTYTRLLSDGCLGPRLKNLSSLSVLFPLYHATEPENGRPGRHVRDHSIQPYYLKDKEPVPGKSGHLIWQWYSWLPRDIPEGPTCSLQSQSKKYFSKSLDQGWPWWDYSLRASVAHTLMLVRQLGHPHKQAGRMC